MNVVLLNVGIPMIFPAIPVMLIALIPVIFLETFYVYKSLSITYWNCLKSVAIANLFSTFIGIPVTWVLLVIVQLISGGGSYREMNSPLKTFFGIALESPWLCPGVRPWIIYASGLFLLIPFFFASWFSEYWIIGYLLWETNQSLIFATIRQANLFSYILLALYLMLLMIMSIPEEFEFEFPRK